MPHHSTPACSSDATAPYARACVNTDPGAQRAVAPRWRASTGADVVPVRVIRRQLLEGASLHDIYPAGQLDLRTREPQRGQAKSAAPSGRSACDG